MTSGAGSAAGDGDNGEPAANRQPAAGCETGAEHAAESQPEKVLGINTEATGLVVIAVALSLLLAALIITVESPLVRPASPRPCWRSPSSTSAR